MTDTTIQSNDAIWRAVAAERLSLAIMLEQFTEQQWDHETLCEGWRVRDIVAHLVIAADSNFFQLLFEAVRARGDLAKMVFDTSIRRANQLSTTELLAQFRGTFESRSTPVSTIPADRLMDILVHGQDIALPLGIEREMPLAAAHSAMERVWEMKHFRAKERFADYRLVATDTAWSAGSGALIEGPIAALLLLTTGRNVSLPQLSGAGAETLRANSRGVR
ncbi:maleylpyruvate isomerase family mycothiol-dependent enzyme [Nocardia sp. NPDC051030]|uniref:maleylpyruvate isomerase family mycothiol-dependent enzyme n=1 Tax=Nocardia sp. NPDC051030 TaxID=3155162 RepID=UPI003430F913